MSSDIIGPRPFANTYSGSARQPILALKASAPRPTSILETRFVRAQSSIADQIEIEIKFVIEAIVEAAIHRVKRRPIMDIPTERDNPGVLADREARSGHSTRGQLMQELDGKNLDLHRGLVGHLMIEGMNSDV